jgi:hypothetical protein
MRKSIRLTPLKQQLQLPIAKMASLISFAILARRFGRTFDLCYPGPADGSSPRADHQRSSATTLTCGLMLADQPRWVATTIASGTYSSSLQIEASAAKAKLTLRLRELQGANQLGQQTAAVTLSTSWQQASLASARWTSGPPRPTFAPRSRKHRPVPVLMSTMHRVQSLRPLSPGEARR